ncbi:hypothetical protein Sango_2316100 [Sesamum angolense]|uniref:Uncharacterized protein n=1 Tax=Sesamum angolense TaxID=2727404 RepID=A0AAE1WAY9_9LAMI|nr:hypothetical protein Sango_2316100 [Sesamum angolense]
MVARCTGRKVCDLEYCKFCGDARYKPSWGETHTGRSLCMLSLEEPRNVRLGLCTYNFAMHSQCGRTCSCWSVSITPYNLPPGMCMSSEYMFLMMLWHVGVRTYDHTTDNAFIMRTTLMWTVNDLPAYGMVSRQFFPEHHPYRRNKKAFIKNHVENKIARLRLTRDQLLDRIANNSSAVEMPLSLPDGYGYDHKWTKKSIFWDLSYWSTLLIRHNFDVMNIEKTRSMVYKLW